MKKQVVRTFYDACVRHDHDVLRPLVTEDVVFHEPGAETSRTPPRRSPRSITRFRSSDRR